MAGISQLRMSVDFGIRMADWGFVRQTGFLLHRHFRSHIPLLLATPCGRQLVVDRPIANVVHKRRVRPATWNIGSLTGKSMELIDVMRGRMINIICIQETRWKGKKGKALDDFKLWYLGDHSHRGGVGIIVDKDLKNDLVDVRRVGDMIIAIKLMLEKEVVNIISAYAPQVGLDEVSKVQFWEDMDGLIQSSLHDEKIPQEVISTDMLGRIDEDIKMFMEDFVLGRGTRRRFQF
ncbi:craniofacial development protein 2-like [Macadamia integrifolia]|uniref:craniofacial development protein 2-like n=1 Tax=Macadamia integrifolia TaxID=60698 RepID=UPI001C4FDB67|nr:craniofacial development protein 2-like [Macadamia integrifolia]